MNIKTAAHYPFLSEASEVIGKFEINITDLHGEQKILIDKAVERVTSAINIAEIVVEFDDYEIELLSYPIAFLLVSYINDPYLNRRWAIAEANKVERHLREETDERILNIGRHQFQWKIKKKETTLVYDLNKPIKATGEHPKKEFEYLIFFTDYLRTAVSFHESKWKLVNRHLVNGWLPVTKTELIRLLRQEIEELMKSKLFIRRSISLPPIVQVAALDLQDYLADNAPEFDKDFKTNLEALPPCIEHILNKLSKSINLSHMERFGFVSFLLKIGIETEQVIDLFRISPDFIENLTRYQVEHIAKGDYTPPACKTFKTNNICKDDGSNMCKKAKHPLGYYRMKNFVLEQRKKRDEGN
jgi:DNA primase large subunit